jgi:hypothetical protein
MDMNVAECNAICQLITAQYKFKSHGRHQGVHFLLMGVKVGFATKCKLQVVYQEVASPEKCTEHSSWVCLHFVVAKLNQVLYFVPSVPGYALYFVER